MKKENNSKTKSSDTYFNKTSIENKVIEKSLDSQVDFDTIDNSKAYYSERYGWTLRKN